MVLRCHPDTATSSGGRRQSRRMNSLTGRAQKWMVGAGLGDIGTRLDRSEYGTVMRTQVAAPAAG